jgi:hypothetical protein
MHAYPILYTQSDGTDLFSLYPNPRVTLIPIRCNRKISQGSYHNFFKFPNIEVKVSPLLSQVKNRVPHELAKTMIGDIASPIDEEKGDTCLDHLFARDENIIQAAGPADGDGRRMFQEQEEIGDPPFDSVMMKPSLKLPSLPIFHYSKIPNVTHLSNPFQCGGSC